MAKAIADGKGNGMTTKEAREQWAQALEGGWYKQGVGSLAANDGYCCLGVACDLAVAWGVIERFDRAEANLAMYRPVRSLFGLVTEKGDYVDELGKERCLSEDNDNWIPFPEIAATIRAEPPGLFDA